MTIGTTTRSDTDARRTLQELLDLSEREPKISNFAYAAARLDTLDPAALALTELRIAMLCSFTVEPALPALKILCASAGYYPHVYVGAYNQIHQEVLDS